MTSALGSATPVMVGDVELVTFGRTIEGTLTAPGVGMNQLTICEGSDSLPFSSTAVM